MILLANLVRTSIDDAKLGTKKHPTERKSIGWELVGVLVGVLPFYKKSVGVLPQNGGSFGVLVGVFNFSLLFLINSPP